MIDVLSWAFILVGGFFAVVGGIGILRLPDLFARMHAAGLTDTLGAWSILLALMLQGGLSLATVKLVMIGLLLAFTSPTATHALARAALATGHQPQLPDEEGPSSKS